MDAPKPVLHPATLLPDELVVNIFKRLHWGDIMKVAYHPSLAGSSWLRAASEPFIWPPNFHFSKGNLSDLSKILQLGGAHFESLKISQLQTGPAGTTEKLLKILQATTPKLRSLSFEQCDLSDCVSMESWRKLFTKLRQLSILRFKKVKIGSTRCLQDLSGFLTGIQLSYQDQFLGTEKVEDFMGQLALTCYRLNWIDLGGTKVSSGGQLASILSRLRHQVTGLNLVLDGKTYVAFTTGISKETCPMLTSLGLQVSPDVDLVDSVGALCRVLGKVSDLKHFKLSGDLQCLTLDRSEWLYRALSATIGNNGTLMDLRINPTLTGWKNRSSEIPAKFLAKLKTCTNLKVCSMTFPLDDRVIVSLLENCENLETLQVRTNQESNGSVFQKLCDQSVCRKLKYLFVMGHGSVPLQSFEQLSKSRRDLSWTYESHTSGGRVSWQNPVLESRPDLIAMSHDLMNGFADCY